MDKRKLIKKIAPVGSIYLLALLLFVILAVVAKSYWLAATELVIYGMITAYMLFKKDKKTEEIVNYIESMTYNADNAAKDSLINFPLPIVVLQLNGLIAWYNEKFQAITPLEHEIYDMSINTLISGVEIQKLVENKEINFETDYAGKHFNIVGNLVKIDEKYDTSYLVVLFWIDSTEAYILKSKYVNEKLVEGIIIIDNYEEVMQNTPEAQRGQLLAEVEREISNWTSVSGGVLKKYERDRFLFLFEQQYLHYMVQSKFDILEKIKEISVGNKIPPTLSIGIGHGGSNLVENDKFAQASIDMALGRGGDQVVIKDESHFSFYGGLSREVERRTRVKARVMAHALRELMASSSKVMIMGHKNADVDCLGSAIGLRRAAKLRGKVAQIVIGEKKNATAALMKKFEGVPEYEDCFISIKEAEETITRNTLLIIVDTHRKALTEAPKLLDKTAQIVVIDHHRRAADFIDNALLIYHEPYASSTCELVTELLQYLGEDTLLSSKEAEALYSGIVMDTKNFTFKTGVRTFEAASYLRRNGVDTIAVKKLFRSDIDTYAKRSDIVRAAEIYHDDIAISQDDSQDDPSGVLIAQAADELMNIKGVDASFVLSKVDTSVHISGRSLGKVNVQVILEDLGGGGHMTVAGVQIPDITIEEARARLKEAIDHYFEQNS